MDFNFELLRRYIDENDDFNHLILCVDTSIADTKDYDSDYDKQKGEAGKFKSLLEHLNKSEINFQIHMIDHHITGYEYWSQIQDQTWLETMQFYNLEDYSTEFYNMIASGFVDNKLHYCYGYKKEISACIMVYQLAKQMFSRFDVKDKFFSSSDISKMFLYVCDYDTGTYKYPDTENFISCFYKKRIKIDVTYSIESFYLIPKMNLYDMIEEGNNIKNDQNRIGTKINVLYF
jgi:hypothetical protein